MIPYHIGEAGDEASLLCAVCAPAVASSMGALCAFDGRGTTSGRRGLGGGIAKGGIAMEIVMRKVSELTPYDKNAKKHDAKQIANVAQSIQEMGWKQPLVVDANGVVIVGHCRLLAAKKLKQKEVPCVVADDLTDEQIRKYRILDNKLAESPWELDLLAEDMADLSFDGYDIDFPELDALTGGGVTTNDMMEGAREFGEEEFGDEHFKCECPRCGFKFNP